MHFEYICYNLLFLKKIISIKILLIKILTTLTCINTYYYKKYLIQVLTLTKKVG